jgi:hypothetical protein
MKRITITLAALSNPYMDESMRTCGEIRKDKASPAPPSHDHHH